MENNYLDDYGRLMEMERREKTRDWIWRIAVTGVMVVLAIIAILTSGCSQGATNITGPSSSTRVTVDSTNDPDLQLVKKYNHSTIERWDRSIITVSDTTSTVFQEDLDDWSQYLNGAKLVLVSGTSGDIEVTGKDDGCGGSADLGNLTLGKVWITVTKPYPGCPQQWMRLTTKHEIGHAVGFIGHTSDGGVMDPYNNGSSTITLDVQKTLRKLYSLPIGTIIL